MSFKIAEVVQRGGVSLQAIRYYEREGLLPKPPSLPSSGYRLFPDTAVRRVHFIKRAHRPDKIVVYSGILRMADLLALQPNMDIKLHIVAPQTKRDKVFSEIRRPVFSLPRHQCSRRKK